MKKLKSIIANIFRYNFFSKKKFLVTLGEEGILLTYLNNNKLELRLFFSHGEEGRQQMREIIENEPYIPTYLIVDTRDQNYQAQTLPPVSQFSISSFIKKRLNREFDNTHLKGALFVNRSNQGRKEWHYIFASLKISDNLNNLINNILEVSECFKGIYLMPVESHSVFSQIAKANKLPKEEKNSWNLLVCNNKSSGIRVVAFKNSAVIISRIINISQEKYADVIAGIIEQELLNTIEFIKRLAHSSQEKFNIITIVSSEIKNFLSPAKFPTTRLMIFTPHEVNKLLLMKNISLPEDKYADVIISAIISNSRKYLPLYTDKMKIFSLFFKLRDIIKISLKIFSLFLIILISYKLMITNRIAAELNINRAQYEISMNNLNKYKEENKKDLEEASSLTDLYEFNKKLITSSVNPFDFFSKLQRVLNENFQVKSVDWTKSNSENSDMSPRIKVEMELDFLNKENSYRKLFENFDNFIEELKKEFTGYNITYSRARDKINFNENNSVISIKVTIQDQIDE